VGSNYDTIIIIIIIIIYLLHKSIQRTKYSNMNSGAGEQGKALTAAQKLQNYTKLYKTKIKIQINICNHTQTLNSQKNPSS